MVGVPLTAGGYRGLRLHHDRYGVGPEQLFIALVITGTTGSHCSVPSRLWRISPRAVHGSRRSRYWLKEAPITPWSGTGCHHSIEARNALNCAVAIRTLIYFFPGW